MSGPQWQERSYVGETTAEATALMEPDRAEAWRHGWDVATQRWDTSQPKPTLVVTFVPYVPAAPGPTQRRSRRGLGVVATIVIAAAVVGFALLAAIGDEGDRPASRPPAAQTLEEKRDAFEQRVKAFSDEVAANKWDAAWSESAQHTLDAFERERVSVRQVCTTDGYRDALERLDVIVGPGRPDPDSDEWEMSHTLAESAIWLRGCKE